MMECVLVNVSQDNFELPKEKRKKRRISKKFYFLNIIIIGFFVLRILDIISTVLCLENIPGAIESNPAAIDIVKKPLFWLMMNLIVSGILFAINFALEIFNQNNDIMFKYIVMSYGVMLLVVLIVCVWPVYNNFGIIVKYIEYF
ncbi:MAG: hypothetical protein ACFE8G_10760 [Candidatus Hermodarchaeota archaeon]